jgi:ribosomal-protein-alanine N-acetyltransferase
MPSHNSMRSLRLETPNLELVAATADLLKAELEDRRVLAALMQAEIPPGWPPPLYQRSDLEWTVTQLRRDSTLCGWLAWFWLQRAQNGAGLPTIIGLGGFKGKPNEFGRVELGYSVIPAFQKRGFATEAVGALIEWAFEEPNVSRVVGETLPELPGSIKVLRKCGFEFVGNGSDIEVLRFERKRSAP